MRLRHIVGALCLAPVLLQGAMPAPQTTAYTRRFLTNNTAVGAINSLGISQTNAYGFDTGQFQVTGSNVAAKAGMPLTNPIVRGTAIQLGVVTNAGTLTNWDFSGAGPNTAARLGDVTNVFHSLSNGGVYYVSPNGSAVGVVGKPDKPWSQLTNALTAAPNGSIIRVQLANYTNHWVQSYYADGWAPIVVTNRVNLELDFGGSTWYWPTQLTGIRIGNCSNIVVRNLNIVQLAKVEPVPQYVTNKANTSVFGAIEVADSTAVGFENIRLSGLYLHGILYDAYGSTKNSTNGWVHKCQFSDIGSYILKTDGKSDGAGVVGTAGISITDCLFDDSITGIEIYNYPTEVKSLPSLVSNCRFNNIRMCSIATHRMPVLVRGNTFYRAPTWPHAIGPSDPGIRGIWMCGGGKDQTASDNVFEHVTYPIILEVFTGTSATNFAVVNNTFMGASTGVTIQSGIYYGLKMVGNSYNDCTNGLEVVAATLYGGQYRLNRHESQVAIAGSYCLGFISGSLAQDFYVTQNSFKTPGYNFAVWCQIAMAAAGRIYLADNDYGTLVYSPMADYYGNALRHRGLTNATTINIPAMNHLQSTNVIVNFNPVSYYNTTNAIRASASIPTLRNLAPNMGLIYDAWPSNTTVWIRFFNMSPGTTASLATNGIPVTLLVDQW